MNSKWICFAAGADKRELCMNRIQEKEKQGNYMCMVSAPNRDIKNLSNVPSLHNTTKTTNTWKSSFNRKLLNILRFVCRIYFFIFFLNNQSLFNSEKCNDTSFYHWYWQQCNINIYTNALFLFVVATDKVALLIGNYDYPNTLMLKTTETDISTLARLFKKLQFKVIALLNLSKTEMLSFVDYFCKLLDKGMYVVFYFCGRGFEENGGCYFVPTDTKPDYTSHDCVSAEFILHRLQLPDPDLIVMIIDVSRKKYVYCITID